jgi:hypothetical protein
MSASCFPWLARSLNTLEAYAMNTSGFSPEISDRAARLTFLAVRQGKKVHHVVKMLKHGRRDEARAFIHREEAKGLS